MQRTLLLAALAFLVASSSVFAQDTGTLTPVEHKQTLSTSPITDLLGFLNAEYQRKVTESFTTGISAGRFEIDDDSYGNVMVFGRYYPQDAALTGFYVGAKAGVHRLNYSLFFGGRESKSLPAVGVDIGYDWLLGTRRNVYIGLGAGAMRLFDGDDDRSDITVAFPTARLNIGFAF